jgi:tRNA/tmRNA/rRNA uracil-C5-methylase (TrmA/RlmC/RlmD family)
VQTALHAVIAKRCSVVDPVTNRPPLVLDVGATLGLFGLLAAKLGCRVRAVEPQARVVRSLQASVCMNGLGELFEVFEHGAEPHLLLRESCLLILVIVQPCPTRPSPCTCVILAMITWEGVA